MTNNDEALWNRVKEHGFLLKMGLLRPLFHKIVDFLAPYIKEPLWSSGYGRKMAFERS